MSFRSANNWLLKTATLLLVPAILIVGSNFVANSKSDTQVISYKAALKTAYTTPAAVDFEADEELEDDNLSDSDFLVSELPGLSGILVTKEPAFAPQIYYSSYQVGHSLNSRAPPAL